MSRSGKVTGVVVAALFALCALAAAGGTYPPQGAGAAGPLVTGDLDEVTGIGASTTNAITATGANTFGANGVTTTFTGTTNATITDGTLSTGTVLLGDGTVNNPAMSFSSDADGTGTGFYLSAANEISLAINGVQEVHCDANTFNFLGVSPRVADGRSLVIGSSNDFTARLGVEQTTDSIVAGIKSDSRALLFLDGDNTLGDYALAAKTNPTLAIYSQTAAASATDEALLLSHDVTDGLIETLSGGLKLSPASGQVLVPGGTALAPSLSFAADPNTGIFRLGADTIGLSTNGVNTMQFWTNVSIFNADARANDDKQFQFGSSGTDRFLQGELTVLTDGVATEFVAIQSALGDAGGVVITYTVKVTTATGVQQSETGTVTISTVDGAGGVTASNIGEVSEPALEAGTLTTTFAVDTTDDGDLEITCNADTSLTPTAMSISWTCNASGDVTLAATP